MSLDVRLDGMSAGLSEAQAGLSAMAGGDAHRATAEAMAEREAASLAESRYAQRSRAVASSNVLRADADGITIGFLAITPPRRDGSAAAMHENTTAGPWLADVEAAGQDALDAWMNDRIPL